MGPCRSGPRELRRKSYGVGSVYKRKSDGLWCASLLDGAIRKYVYGKTRHEVMAKLRATQLTLGTSHIAQRRSPTVEEFLRSWLETSVKPRVRPLTYAGYKVNVEKHLIPTLGKIRLDQLTPQHVQMMMNNRLAAGFSPKTISYLHQVLRTSLGLAVRWDMVFRNVAKLVDMSRVDRMP